MDAVEYITKKSKICKNRACNTCPIKEFMRKFGHSGACDEFEENYPNLIVNIVKEFNLE